MFQLCVIGFSRHCSLSDHPFLRLSEYGCSSPVIRLEIDGILSLFLAVSNKNKKKRLYKI
ncbi:hypothetical protein Hanom_Chr01g00081341 [Helianthus anomalus]